MRFEPTVCDVHGAMHGADDGVPASGAHPWELFGAILQWCREHNVMPREISLGYSEKERAEGLAEDE
jgi:hypothetical protein